MASKNNKKRYSLSNYELNRENPFINQSIEQVQNNIVKKYKAATNTGEGAVLKAIDDNGEVKGHTTFLRQIEVDEEQFAKIYLSNFSAFFGLTNAAVKVFGYILTQLIPNRDEFLFLVDDCLEYTKYKAKSSVFEGLGQLVEHGIIARGKVDVLYYINPMVAFNGNRITFAKTYIKKTKDKVSSIDSNQTNFLDAIDNAEKE